MFSQIITFFFNSKDVLKDVLNTGQLSTIQKNTVKIIQMT